MNVDKQIEEFKDFTKITELMKVILDKQTNLDKNNLYDLVYCKKKLEDMLSKGVDNDDIKINSLELINQVDVILNLIGNEKIEKILKKKSKRSKHIDKTKYGIADKFNHLEDPSRTHVEFNNPVSEYLQKSGFRIFVFLVLTPLLILYPDFINSITVIGTLATKLGISADTLYMIIKLVIMIIAMFNVTKLCVDLMYITLPIFRARTSDLPQTFMGRESVSNMYNHRVNAFDIMVSDAAKIAVNHDGTYIIHHKVVDGDRLDLAETMLNKCYETVKPWVLSNSTGLFDLGKSDSTLREFESIESDIEIIKKTLKNKDLKPIDKLHAYVDVELIYERLERAVKSEQEKINKAFNDIEVICK